MGNTKGEVYPKLNLSITRREGRIRIGKGVAKALGDPEYVCIYVSTEDDALMVKECKQKEFLSIKVTKNDNSTPKDDLLLYSLRFTTDLYLKNDWNPDLTYQMLGEYDKKLNAVVFRYQDAAVREADNKKSTD